MSRAYRKYTPEEDAYIIANYKYNNLQNIADYLGRPYMNVQMHCMKVLKLSTKWTDEETEFLEIHSGMSNEWIAKQLGKTINAVKSKKERMGLCSIIDSRYDQVNIREACRMTGIAPSSMYRYCYEKRIKTTKAGNYRFIKMKELFRFMKDNPHLWKASECETWHFEEFDWFQQKRKHDFNNLVNERWGGYA